MTVQVFDGAISIDFDDGVAEEVKSALRAQWSHLASGQPGRQRLIATTTQPATTSSPFAFGTTAADLAANVRSAVSAMARASAVASDARTSRPLPMSAATVRESGASSATMLFGTGREEAIHALSSSVVYLGLDAARVDLEKATVEGLPVPVIDPASGRLAAPAVVGMSVGSGAHRIGTVALLIHAPDESPHWVPVSVPEMSAAVLPWAPALTSSPIPLGVLGGVLERVPLLAAVRYRSQDDLPALFADLWASEAPPRGEISASDTRPEEEETAVPVIGDVRRAAMVDAIDDGSFLAVCDGQYQAAAVSGIALAIWQCAGTWIGLDELTRRVVQVVGEPTADPRALVTAAVDALVARSILVRV